MKTQTQIKAGGFTINHNQKQVAETPDAGSKKQAPPSDGVDPKPRKPRKLRKTIVEKLQGMSWNHNQTQVRKAS